MLDIAYRLQEGVNLAVFAANAEQLSVCLFTEADLQQGRVTSEVTLDPVTNRTGDIWHVMLPQLDATSLYGMHCKLYASHQLNACLYRATAWLLLQHVQSSCKTTGTHSNHKLLMDVLVL